MSIAYQALLGETNVDLNSITVDVLEANTVKVDKTLVVKSDLVIPTDAQDKYVLTSDIDGNATWKPNNPVLAGDVTGSANNTVVEVVGGQLAGDVALATLDVLSSASTNQFGHIVRRDDVGNIAVSDLSAKSLVLNNQVYPNSISLHVPYTDALENQEYILPIHNGIQGDVLSLGIDNQMQWTDVSTLSGDVTGPSGSNTVAWVGGRAASEIAVVSQMVIAATPNTVASTIVRRDTTGSVQSNNITIKKMILTPTTGASISFEPPTGSSAQPYILPTALGSAGAILSQSDATGTLAWKTSNFNLTGECTSVGNASTLSNSAVIGKVLTGFVSGSGTITASDSIISAIQKLSGASGTATLTGDCNGSSSSNTVTSLRGNTISIPVATDTLVCKNTVDTLTNKTLSAPTLTGTMTTSGAGMTLKQTGDGLGTSSLVICNRAGTNGAMIQQNNTTYDLCDIGLYSQLSGQIAVMRLEKRLTSLSSSSNSTNGELQLKPNTNTSSIAFVVGEVLSKFNMPLTVNGSVTSATYNAPTAQGAFLAWNRSGSSGRATFGNQQGGGSGGFEWVNYNNSNALVGNIPLMSLAADGNLFVSGGLSLINTAGGTQSVLNHYEEYTFTTQFVGATTSDVITFKMVRIGKLVYMTVASPSEWVLAVTNNTTGLANSSYFPTRFNPLVATQSMINVISGTTNTSYTFGTVTIGGDGLIQIGVGATQSPFSSTKVGFRAFTASWVVNF